MKLERSLVLLEEGPKCTGDGPTSPSRKKRQYYEDLRRSNKYADEILCNDNDDYDDDDDDDDDDDGSTKVPDDPNCKHRPANPSVSRLSSSDDDDITPARSKKSSNKRTSRRRSEKSQQFLKVLKLAENIKFTVTSKVLSKNAITFVITNEYGKEFSVNIRQSPFCNVCNNYHSKTKQTCVHIVWCLVHECNIPTSSYLLAQVSFTLNEIEQILSEQNCQSTSATSPAKTHLSEPEMNGIFEKQQSKEQTWYVDKLIVRKDAKCCSCKATMPAGKIYIYVQGLFIPPNQNFAVDRQFYFCALSSCLARKPFMSNLRVPPSQVSVAQGSRLDTDDIVTIKSRDINIV